MANDKLDIRFNLPKLDWFGAHLDISEGNNPVVYEGKMYDLKAVFQKADVSGLHIFGKVNLRKTSISKKTLEQKPDTDNFAPQKIGMETPEEEWAIGDSNESSRRLLFSGRNNRSDYMQALYTSAYNNGIWIRPQRVIEPIFVHIEKEIDKWYVQVYKLFKVGEE